MNLKAHYDHLYQEAIQKIQSDAYQLDEWIDAPIDDRLGITLLLRPGYEVRREIQRLLSKIKQIDSNQYFYPDSDLHVTVMSIISCYNGFSLQQIQIKDYINLIQKSIDGLSTFDIEFKGLTASPSCLMVQGFFKNNTLDAIRDNLRKHFKNANLEQSIDKRYALQSAHSTIFRLKEKLNNKEALLKIIEEYRNYNFGTFNVDSLELVFNDWYQRKEHVQTLYEFKLKAQAY